MIADNDSLGVDARIVADNGRWVVYLGVEFWNAVAVDNPVETVWHRIADFPTFAAAQVAARWYRRGADRSRPHQQSEEPGDARA